MWEEESGINHRVNNAIDGTNVDDLVRLHRIISMLLKELEEATDKGPPFDEVEHIFGSKENVISVITKLSQIMFKISPLMEKIQAGEEVESATSEEAAISEEDYRIVEAFIARYNAKGCS